MTDTRIQGLINQLNAIVERYYGYKRSKEPTTRQLTGLLASVEAAIERAAPPNSPYIRNYQLILQGSISEDYTLDRLVGIIEALRDDLVIGGLSPFQDILRAEVFDDFLEMASHLMETGYKDPSAVLVGGVLEQHLRKLCIKASIPIEIDGKPKKADQMNSELSREGFYGKLDHKSVTAWLDLRNKAAHAEYDSYSIEQVQTMLLGVRDFVSRTTV